MKRTILGILLAGCFFFSFSQRPAPVIKWEKSFGGSSIEKFYLLADNHPGLSKALLEEPDGYVIAGESNSLNGDIVNGHGNIDIWIAKLDSSRNIQWSVTLGGSSQEHLGAVQRDLDGGYILAGSTASNNGDVSGNHGGEDAWIIKLSATGSIIWKRCYGGTAAEQATFIQPVGRSGYIFLGVATSDNGDVSGLHNLYTPDIWVVRLNNSGDIMWQKCLGGFASDIEATLKITADGGFILGGRTESNNGDIKGTMHGFYDIWVVKLSATGNIEWEKCLGGTSLEEVGDIEPTVDGGYIIAGGTFSSDGDVTGLKGQMDAWVVKLSSSGQIEWQKCFGGPAIETFSDITVLPDDSYVAVGHTASVNGDVSNIHGGYDIWLVKFDLSGNIIWEKTYGGTGNDMATSLLPVSSDEFLILGQTTSNDQDVSLNKGNTDFWFLRVGKLNFITGKVYYDSNSNGSQDIGEPAISDFKVEAQKNGVSISAFPSNGVYRIQVEEEGNFITQVFPSLNYFTINPPSLTASFVGYFNTAIIDFALQPIPNQRDLSVSLVPQTPARPGFNVSYFLQYKNLGTVTASGKLKFVKDHRLGLISATPMQSSVNGDTLIWHYSDLYPQTGGSITITLRIPAPGVIVNDILYSLAWIEQDGVDLTPSDNTSTLKQLVRGSYDPNDKTESNAGIVSPQQILQGECLNYLIRFQNSGTDTAFTVIVRDTLENKLDWSTLQIISASHNYQLSVLDGNKLSWQFDNIQLPDSNVNESASHGYIAYRIKPKNTVAVGDTIKNSASIYFDYNLPVQTNTEKTVVANLASLPVHLSFFNAVLHKDVVEVSWETAAEEKVSFFEIERSQGGTSFVPIGKLKARNMQNGSSYLFTDNHPHKGYNYYRLRSVDVDGSFAYSQVVRVNVNEENSIISSISPNPGNGQVLLKLEGLVNGKVMIEVFDHSGRKVIVKDMGYQHVQQLEVPLNLKALSKGVYVLKVNSDGINYTHRLIIQ